MDIGIDSNNILARIVERRREAIAHRKRVLPVVALKIAVEKKAPPVRDFPASLTHSGFNVIAELKKASPSGGLLRADYQPAIMAPMLEAAGAAAISVLTEEDFFQGSLRDLKEVSKATKIPILRKDFIVDPWQIWETRAAGADSFLLIAAIMNDRSLRELLALGRQLKMEPLVEVHSRNELQRAQDADAKIIGVNNRDLKTFDVRLETSLELVSEIPEECIAVSESGIRTHEDLTRLRAAGFDAFLIGEHLMTMSEPSLGLRELLGTSAAAVSSMNTGVPK
ncbi:MAG TPA: indole-3-glycerol phosphate synthase TrpC [Candidatus Acidoferrales bacterium]|nr:indole-3-glycerol phosphate synthase TrpC [Candidatus Acidoferrales bacterium]